MALAAGPLAVAIIASCGGSGGSDLLLGATTSLQDTGLLEEIIQAFEEQTGYKITPIVGGSAQILETARRGELDVVITHSPDDEAGFVSDGHGIDSRAVMKNYFATVGPPDDPAGAAEAATLAEAFQRIASRQAVFVSRGDRSGTHLRELAVWEAAGIQPAGESWYQESGSGQGQSLLVASEKRGYTLVDTSTVAVFQTRVDLATFLIDFESPNVYSVTRVNPAMHDAVNSAVALAFSQFITSIAGQCIIEQFGMEEYGQSLFTPLGECTSAKTGG